MQSSKSLKDHLTIGIVAGESSGDNLGAALVREIKRNAPDTPTFNSTADIGLPSLPPPSDISNMALWLRDPASNFNKP